MDLHGWDTVYVISTEKVNAALAARSDQLLMDFAATPGDSLPVEASGQFSSWELVEGGSGDIVYLRLTIGSGTCKLTSTTPKTVDLAGVALTVAVQLHLLPGETTQSLAFDIATVGEEGQPTEPGMITPVTLHEPSGTLDPAEQALLTVALLQYIVANADKISFVFATVNLVPPETDTWLTPVRSAYAYADRPAGGGGSLAILSVTTDREVAELPRLIDPVLLSIDYDASFGISQALYLEHVVQPSLPATFGHGTTDATFAFDAGNGQIVNTQPIATDQVKSGAIWYSPRIVTLTITTTGSGLASSYYGDCDVKMGMSMEYWVDARNAAVFNPDTVTIAFEPDPAPSVRKAEHIPWYMWLFGPLVKLVVDLVVKLITDTIVGGLAQEAGSKISFLRTPPSSVQWAETSALSVENAGVSVGLYLQGSV